jgi:hypothetical protein
LPDIFNKLNSQPSLTNRPAVASLVSAEISVARTLFSSVLFPDHC